MIDKSKVTTEEAVAIYQATNNIFLGLLKEMRELSKKKPDAIMSSGKVSLINRVLVDLKQLLGFEPEEKFLDLLDDSNLPQISDAVLVMVQYETALKSYKGRYFQSYREAGNLKQAWVTPSLLKNLKEDGSH